MSQALFDDHPSITASMYAAVSSVVDQLALRYQDTGDRSAWVVAFSGGKDSTLLLHLVLEAVKKVRPSRRTRPLHVLSSDTQVETPAVAQFVRDQLSRIQHGADQLSLPVTTHLVRPELHETFWVRLIGYGYAAPTRNFRWCTDRLKIKPANVLLAALVADHGSALVLTGSRYSESAHRAASLRKHTAAGAINRHSTVRSAWIWAPIRDLTTEQVWEYLGLTPAPWGGHHREFYRPSHDQN
jgi:DNA sulfur modification protein DndC